MPLKEVIGEHEFYCCGARIRLKNGELQILSEPKVIHCPLMEGMYGVREINSETIKRIVETKVQRFGFCCAHRLFDSSIVVPYGSSEVISACIEDGLIDCGVTVCEGAGTIITTNPKLIQEIGARLTGIIRTSPIKSIIEHIKSSGGLILNEHTAKINQAEGVMLAAELGYKRIAVTVAGFDSDSIEAIRRIERERSLSVTIFSVCNTCVTREDAERIALGADVACASASKIMRKVVGSRALMQLGVAIPIFALTKMGKKLLLSYLTRFEGKIVAFRVHNLPYLAEGREPRLRENKH